MSERHENLFRQPEEQPTPPEIQAAETPESITEFLAFADPILSVDWGSEGPPEEYTPVWIAQHPELTRIFTAQDNAETVVAGAKVKMIDERTRERLGLNTRDLDEQTGVLFEYEVVRADYRKQGLLKALTEKRMAWAKEQGADYVCAEIAIDTPISAFIKTRQGFSYVGIQEPGEGIPEPYFVVVKSLSNEESKTSTDQLTVERKEVEVNKEALNIFPQLFSDGWVGVDAKIDNDKLPWTLVLEKRK